MPNTYLDLTYMYCMEDIKLKVIYPNNQRNNDLTGYETPNGGFAIDEEGNMYANNGTFTGGNIELTSEQSIDSGAETKLKVSHTSNSENSMNVYPDRIVLERASGASAYFGTGTYSNQYQTSERGGASFESSDGSSMLLTPNIVNVSSTTGSRFLLNYLEGSIAAQMYSGNANENPYVSIYNETQQTYIEPGGVWSPGFNNNSLESKKKNIELDNGCLEEIINSDVASFNWKYEDDEDQKHIGLIIANETGKYKVSPKVLTHDKDAIDLYSMNGMAWKGIQELYNIVIEQQKKIKELEEKLNGIIETNKTK